MTPKVRNTEHHHCQRRSCHYMYAVTRAVIVIGDIDVSIKKSCDIHIDTKNWISILIDIGSCKNCCFLPGGLHHGGLNQASMLNQTF